jgi:hypothetical protein
LGCNKRDWVNLIRKREKREKRKKGEETVYCDPSMTG